MVHHSAGVLSVFTTWHGCHVLNSTLEALNGKYCSCFSFMIAHACACSHVNKFPMGCVGAWVTVAGDNLHAVIVNTTDPWVTC